jgi:hypothetical protein
MIDIFNDSAFNVVSMTAAVNDFEYVPGRISRLGLFDEEGVTTTSVAVERMGDALALVPVSPRGGVPPTPPRARAALYPVSAARLALQDSVVADEVQNVRAFGTESTLMTVQSLVNQRLRNMARACDVTLEFHRLGALRGQLLDANGVSILADYHTLWGVSAQSVVDMDLDDATPASGALMGSFTSIHRMIEDELEGIPYTRIHGFAGSAFMDALYAHPEYRDTFQAVNAAQLRDRQMRIAASFAGFEIEEYRGTVGGVQFVADDEAIFFPVGAQGVYRTYFAPADYLETVNTLGLPRYAKMGRPDSFDRLQPLEVQTNPITINTRPRATIRATLT